MQLLSAASTNGNGNWVDWTGRFSTKSAHLGGSLDGATVTLQARLDADSTAGIPVNGYSETATGVENISIRTHSLRAVITGGGSSMAIDLDLV